MVVIPSGSFTMGAPASQSQTPQYTLEIPQHVVTIAKPFAVGKYELTFADWDACVAGGGCNGYVPNDISFGRGRQPAISVNWDDAQQYVAWLSLVTGKTYRLLSEAEYEYAARAGTTTLYPWGNDIKLNGAAMASCKGCGSQWDNAHPAPVGSFPPNRFGLYDMVGNVFEWTEDCNHISYKGAPSDGSAWIAGGDCRYHIVRGASCYMDQVYLRPQYRIMYDALVRGGYLGFRVARTLDR